MKGLVWGFFGLLAALWSLAAWALHGLAGAGPAAVTTLTRWLGLDLAQTQWIADGLGAAGWLAQALVLLFWLMGLGLLGLFGLMSSRAVDGMAQLGEEVARARDEAGRGIGGGIGGGPVIEGEAISVRRAAPPQLHRPEPQREPPNG
jgi:hypothetical protein